MSSRPDERERERARERERERARERERERREREREEKERERRAMPDASQFPWEVAVKYVPGSRKPIGSALYF
jgi:hypothetical protein